MLRERSMFYVDVAQIGLQGLLESLGRSLGVGLMVTYPDGRPLSEAPRQCSFCAMLNRNPKARQMCAASREASARAAIVAGERVLHVCHAGLVYEAVPLEVAAETVAVVLVGNVALQPLPKETVVRLAVETGADVDKLLAAAQAVPVWTQERLRTAVAAVKKVADTIARLLYAKGELEQKADKLAALYEFSQTVSASLDLAEVARRALQMVLELSGATSGSVVMLSGEGHEGPARELAATLESSDEFRVVPPGEVVAVVNRETRAVRFNGRPGGSTPEERRPAVALPLMVGGKVTGVLTIAGKREGAGFGEDEIAFLTTLGTNLGLALENARLFRKLQMRAAMLERLIEVGQEISGSLDVGVVIESVLGSVRDVLGVEWCALRLLDEEAGELVLKGSIGLDGDLQTKAGRVRPGGLVLGKVLRTMEPVVIDDLTASAQDVDLPYYLKEMRAIAIVPVLAREKVVGTLEICSPTPRRWSEEDVGYLRVIASQAGLAVENTRLHSALREYYWSAVQSLAAALEAKDIYTRGHSLRVARWARTCAKMLGLSQEEQEQVYLAGLLHDVGKIGVHESILLKPGALNGEEREEVRNHPVVGAMILEPARFPGSVIAAVRHHHEDYGGGGYPAGLAGEQIPLLARIIRVVDAYDAITSARPYRQRLSVQDAREELRRGSGEQFDPRVVDVFLRIPAEELENNGDGGGGG
ncbi:MAG TPA: GAF domain-containing protein, partial [Firmicutes bacterium]|nr:GAF domain-containing protein [Bacillota bacterium]